MQLSVALHLEADPVTVPIARHLLLATLSARGADEQLAGDLAVALSEACTNAVEHAGGSGYTVSWTVTNRRCDMEVRDDGAGLASDGPFSMPSPQAAGGRGLPLIALLVDDVSIEAEPGAGTAIRMRHELGRV